MLRLARFIFGVVLMAALVACAQPTSFSAVEGAAVPAGPTVYQLGTGDRLRVTVFGEASLTGEYAVGASGALSLPLIGDVPALGLSPADLERAITTRYAAGFLNQPRVSIEVLTYRPFFILGEVNKPGEYPYSSGLTVLNAVALAGGFTYRANQRQVYLKHAGEDREQPVTLTTAVPVNPGDTVRIGERYF